MRVSFTGQLRPGVTAKDMMLHLLAQYGAGGGARHAVEFAGEAVRSLCMEARMTLCNMATEFAAFTGIVAPDDQTFEYLRGRRYASDPLPDWSHLKSDEGAAFDVEILVDADLIEPMVSWGTSPEHSVAIVGTVPASANDKVLDYIGLKRGQALAGVPPTPCCTCGRARGRSWWR